MIEFKFNCPACEQHILANDAYSGRQIDCPTCRAILVVPAAPGATPLPPATAVPPPLPAQAAPAPAARQQRPPVPPVKKSGIKWLIVGGAAALVIAAGLVVVFLTGMFRHSDSISGSLPDKISAARKVSGSAAAADVTGLSAAEIVQKVTDQYAAFTSYSAEGTGLAVIDMSKVNMKNLPGMGKNLGNAKQTKDLKDTMSKPMKTESDFTLKLGRPGLYRVEWNMSAGAMGGNMKGAAWSTGDGDFLLINPAKYVKLDNRELALTSAMGMSGGAAGTVPAIFFNDQSSQLSSFKTAQRGPDETIDGEDCYVLKSKVMGMQTSLWITKETFLIKQKQTIFGGKSAAPDLSDAQIDDQLKKMGDMTPAQKAQAKAAAKQMKPMVEQMKGQMTETYHNIVTNKSLSKTDFKYDLPADAVLSKSFF